MMKLKALYSYLFENSLKPVLFNMLALPLLLLGMLSGVGLLQAIGGFLFLVGGLWLILSFFVLLFKREWRKCWYTLLFMLTILMVIGLLGG